MSRARQGPAPEQCAAGDLRGRIAVADLLDGDRVLQDGSRTAWELDVQLRTCRAEQLPERLCGPAVRALPLQLLSRRPGLGHHHARCRRVRRLCVCEAEEPVDRTALVRGSRLDHDPPRSHRDSALPRGAFPRLAGQLSRHRSPHGPERGRHLHPAPGDHGPPGRVVRCRTHGRRVGSGDPAARGRADHPVEPDGGRDPHLQLELELPTSGPWSSPQATNCGRSRSAWPRSK